MSILVFAGWLLFTAAAGVVPFADRPDAAFVDQLAEMGGLVGTMIVLFGYVPIAFIVNRTAFHVDGGTLSVRHGPLPWARTKTTSVVGVTSFSIGKVPGQPDWKRTPDRAVLAWVTHDACIPVWIYNRNLVPEEHVVAVCRLLERHAHSMSRAPSSA